MRSSADSRSSKELRTVNPKHLFSTYQIVEEVYFSMQTMQNVADLDQHTGKIYK